MINIDYFPTNNFKYSLSKHHYNDSCSVPKNRPHYVDSQSHKKSLRFRFGPAQIAEEITVL